MTSVMPLGAFMTSTFGDTRFDSLNKKLNILFSKVVSFFFVEMLQKIIRPFLNLISEECETERVIPQTQNESFSKPVRF